MPSSRSIFARNPSIRKAFSTDGILNSTSADRAGLKTIFDREPRTRQTVLGQAVRRHDGPGVADIERLTDGDRVFDASHQAVHKVIDEAPGPDLIAVAVDLDFLILEGVLDEDLNGPFAGPVPGRKR